MATALHVRTKPLEHLPGIRANLRAMDDSELVEAYLMGNELAFNEIVDRYETRLLHFVTRLTSDKDRAEDLVQETFLRVHQHIRRFDTVRKFSTWIYTIAGNLARNEIRNRSRRRIIPFSQLRQDPDESDAPIQFQDERNLPDDMLHKRHLRSLVEAIIQRLPEHHRRPFVLREVEGKTYDEIAEICECNLGTVKSRLNRARTAFAAIIGPFVN